MALPSFLTRRPWGQKPEKRKPPEEKPDRQPERLKLFQEWNDYVDTTMTILKETGLNGVMFEEASVFLKASIPHALARGDAVNVQRLVSTLDAIESLDSKRKKVWDRFYDLFDNRQDVVDWLDRERAERIAVAQQPYTEKTSMN